MSERDVADYSLDALVLDVEAVADHLGLGKFGLLGAADGGQVAVAYAARHPDRVSRLILWCSWARTVDISSPRIQALLGLIDQDWDLMTETCAHLALGWSAGEIGRYAAERLRETVTREGAKAALAAHGRFDVTALLPKVQAPTLVVHRRDISWLPLGIARDLASRLHDARLTVLAGEATAPYLGEMEAAAAAIDEFLEADLDGGRADLIEVGSATRLLEADAKDGFESQRRRALGSLNGLTQREVEVLRLIASGRTNNEIAKELYLSVRTVERHITNIYGKINARGRADATAYALTRGII